MESFYGVKKYPLIGNLLLMPSTLKWETFVRFKMPDLPLSSNLVLCTDSNIFSCQHFRENDGYLKLIRSCHLPSRPKL